MILDRTPFYGESGGQVGDTGYIVAAGGTVRISDCKKTSDGKYLHIGVVEKGIIEKNENVKAKIDFKRRMDISRNHSTTHLLHKALKNVLGDHVNQAGSLVEPGRLRFDFTHFSSVDPDDLKKIEQEVNEKILESLPVTIMEMPLDEARKLGAMALFGEKYGDVVRVVKMGDYSLELCGGTHLNNTSQAGFIKIISESGIASGVRRIEALTGRAAIEYFNDRERLLNEAAYALKSNPQDIVRKVEALTSELKESEKEIERLRGKLVSSSLDDVLSRAVEVKGIKVVTARFDQLDIEGLRNTGDSLKSRMGSGVVALASSYGDKVSFVITATKDVVEKGIHSGNIIREVARIAGGGGGGRPDMAQAGGKDVSKIDEALRHVISIVETQVK